MRIRNPYILTILTLTVSAATLLQSCTFHEKETINERIPMGIGVEEAGTKAIVEGETASERMSAMVSQCFDGAELKENAGFGMYGFKKVSETSTQLFDNTLIYPDQNSPATTWSYSPLRFWDLTASYQFIAYWPYREATSGNGFHVTSMAPARPDPIEDQHKEIRLHHVPNWQMVNDTVKDIMTATTVGRYNPDFSFFGSVRMSFRHILSQLVIKAYYIGTKIGDEQGGVVIEGIKLIKSGDIVLVDNQGNEILDNENQQQIFQVQVLGDGTTEFSQRYDDERAVSGSVDDDLADEYQLPWNAPENNRMIAFKDELDPESFEGPTTVNRWLMVPHKWQEINLEVTYKIGTEANSKISAPVPVTLGAQFDNYVTLPGKKYVITLLIDTSNGGLTVGSVGVETWTTHNVQREFYNW